MLMQFKRLVILLAAVCLLWGISRATSVKFEQQKEAFLKIAAAERARLGITNHAQATAKYPTPEITLCKLTKVAPGGTATIVLPGKYVAGTKFLYENDSIEVVNDAVTAAQYRATIRVANDALPCVTLVHAIAPVSGAPAFCKAVHVAGGVLPDWEFAAANGWTIKLVEGEEKMEGSDPVATYSVQFYRRGESQPFEVFPGWMSLLDGCPRANYTVDLKIPDAAAGDKPPVEEYMELAKRASDPKITPAEYEKVLARMAQLAEKMQASSEATMANVTKNNEASMRLEKFGCKHFNFSVAAGAATGIMRCTDLNTGQSKDTKITGSAKARAK